MTGNEIIKRCVDLLGYRDGAGDEDLEASAKKSAAEYINQILLDICIANGQEYQPIERLDDTIMELNAIETSALIFGVSMWIAFSVGDSEKHSVFANLYNAKRTALSRIDTIRDTIPNPEG